MTPPPRLTHARMERSLRNALTSGNVVLVHTKLQNCVAVVNVDRVPHVIQFDPLRGAVMDSIVHELLHVVWNDQLESWGTLEETVTEAIEEQIVRFINRSKSRIDWWRARIDEALEDTE